MSLQYCSQHNRLFVQGQHIWIAFPADLITRIKELYQRFPLPDFEVVDRPCDRCDEEGEQRGPEP